MGDERFYALRPMELLVREGAMRPRRAAHRAWAGASPDAWVGADAASKLADGLVFVARHPKQPLPAPSTGRASVSDAAAAGDPALGVGVGSPGARARAARPWPSAAHCPTAATSACDCDDLIGLGRDYCGRTTLHGLKYVGDQELHVVERVFWLIVFLIAVVAAVYYILFLYDKWKENPMIVSLSPYATKITEIPFPAVTVCNMNRAKKSVAEDILQKGLDNDNDLLKDLCDINVTKEEKKSSETYSSSQWDTVQNFLVRVGQPCHELLHVCRYGGIEIKCIDFFNPSLTDEGICCSFNKVQREYLFRNPRDLSDLNVSFPGKQVDWTPEAGYPPLTPSVATPMRPVGVGVHLGLSLVLDAQVDEYFCSTTASVGFKVVLHSPVETPKIANMGLVLSPGEELRVGVRPRISYSTPQLRDIPIEKRQCFFSGEHPLMFYRTYTQRNCALECEANYTLTHCACVLPYMPKDSKTRICGRNEESCALAARKEMEVTFVPEEVTANTVVRPKCNCLPGCSEINYRTYLSSSNIVPEFTFSTEYTTDTNLTYFRKNMAIVHLFFLESQYTSHLKGELFGFTEFLSSTGGLLGLFMGFSFMSLVEVVYHITLRLWCAVRKNRRNLHFEHQSNLHTQPAFAIYPFTQ